MAKVQKLAPQKVSGSSQRKPKVNTSNRFGIKAAKVSSGSAVTTKVKGRGPRKSVF